MINQQNNMSESVNELASALSKAQAVMESAIKDSNNPFFKSKYADLAAIWSACKKPLTDNGLSIVQQIGSEDEHVTMTTILLHSSGQWIKSTAKAIPAKKDPQGIGSTATYLRRYGLSALVGICTEDDDGNEGSGNYSSRFNDTRKVKHYAKEKSVQEPKAEKRQAKGVKEQIEEIGDEYDEIQEWRDHIRDLFLTRSSSPFYGNPKEAAQFAKDEVGKNLGDMNAVEMEELLSRFYRKYPELEDKAL